MITRFRLEAAGTTQQDCIVQLNEAIGEIFRMEATLPTSWDTTDFVTYKDGPIYRGRIVMKLKEAEVVT